MSSAQSKAKEVESTFETVKDTVKDYAARPVQVVREHPIPATLVMFGIGLGLGVIIASQACEAMFHQETTSERLTRQFNDGMSEIKSMLQRGIAGIRG